MNDDVLVRVEGVSKKFCRDLKRSLWYGVQDTVSDLLGLAGSHEQLRHDEFWAIDDISFELKRGECLGLIGRNGAGKTTLFKMLNGLIKPDKGCVKIRGRVGALIALGTGFNPILTGRENIYVNGAVLGLSKREIDKKFDDIVEFAEISEFIDAPVQSYSSGMQVRLGFAVATAMEPDVLIIDEVLAVGDVNFQAKCYHRIGKLLSKTAVILVSHYAYHIRKICDQALLLEKGKKLIHARPDVVLAQYLNSQSDYQNDPFTLLGEDVKRAEVATLTPEIAAGDNLELVLRIEMSKPKTCDQAHLNILDAAGNVHAQVILEELTQVELNAGLTEVLISVGPLHLSQGRFEGQLAMWTSGGKATLAQLRNCFGFSNNGPVSMGPFYYPPCRTKFGTSRASLRPASIAIDRSAS